MMVHDCIPCQHGYHDDHQDVPGPVAEGVIGGWVCECKGECRDRVQPLAVTRVEEWPDEEMMDAMRTLAELSRLVNESDNAS